MRSLLILGSLFVISSPAGAGPIEPCAAAKLASGAFLRDFENLDWNGFRSWFAPDVTAFFPPPEPPTRFSGRTQVENQFKKVFAEIRAHSSSKSPPFHRLPPVDLRCDPISKDAALVSFLLENDERTGRRTLLWQRLGTQWRITHLHASSVAK